MKKIVYLEVNESGAWKRVMSTDLQTFDDGDLEFAAEKLLALSDNPRIKARIIVPGDSAPLLIYTRDNGWREWEQRD
jgi:hypothetical protein